MSDHSERRGEQSVGGGADVPAPRPRFRQTLLRVMSMQLFALLVLWLIQRRYAH